MQWSLTERILLDITQILKIKKHALVGLNDLINQHAILLGRIHRVENTEYDLT